MPGLAEASWSDIEAMRAQLAAGKPRSVQEGAAQLASLFATRFSTVVLARVFLVVAFDRLPPYDKAFARAVAGNDPRLTGATPVLSLLGTHGRRAEWSDRARSVGHLAIPLLDRASVQAAPMIARLLEDLEVDFQGLAARTAGATGGPRWPRPMTGGGTAMFYVPDARTTRDEHGRPIIQPEFASRHGVETVFGMRGSYLDGAIAIAIVFCAERLERIVADRYRSFITSFQMATMDLKNEGRVWSS